MHAIQEKYCLLIVKPLKRMSVTEYFQRIEKTNVFIFAVVVIFSLYFATTVFPIDVRHVAGIALGLAIIFVFEDRNRSDINDFHHSFEVKLGNIIPRPEYFHTDVNIVDLFDNITDFKEYNPQAWTELIKSTDNVLRLHSDMKKGVVHCAENIETANMFKTNAVNHFHSFIMSLPSNSVLNTKFKKNVKRFELLLRRRIDDMYAICKHQYKKQGWNIGRRPLANVGPRPNDIGAIGVSQFDHYY